MGTVGGVAARPLYGLVTRVGGRIDKRQMGNGMAVGIVAGNGLTIRPISRAVDVRIYSDASIAGGGMAAVSQAAVRRAAEKLLPDSNADTNGIFVLVMSARVVAVGNSCEGKG